MGWFVLQVPSTPLVSRHSLNPLPHESHSLGSSLVLVNILALTQLAAQSFCLGCTSVVLSQGDSSEVGFQEKRSPQRSCTWPRLCVPCPLSSMYPEYILILRRFLLDCFHTVGGKERASLSGRFLMYRTEDTCFDLYSVYCLLC